MEKLIATVLCNVSTQTKMSSNTVPRRSARLAAKMATQPLRRSPRLAKLEPQTFEEVPQKATRQISQKTPEQPSTFVYSEAFEQDMIRTCKKLRKYYTRFVSLFEETTNTPEPDDCQKAEIAFNIRLNLLGQRYPGSLLAAALSLPLDSHMGRVASTTKLFTL